MAVPSLRIPLSLNMDGFQKNIESAKGITSTATKFITKQFIDLNASMLATQGAAGSAVLGFRSILGVLGPLALAITGIVGVFKLMGLATELAKEKIQEFNEIADKAAKANVSTDFFQRFTKSGEILKVTVDEVIDALNKFNAVSKDVLGGSALNQEVSKLSGFGNFAGNSGVGALSGATDTESKLRATVQLIDQALQSGQRLAALDISEKAFGPTLTNALRQDSGFLDQMLKSADEISKAKIISDEQVGQAIQLKTRLDEAQKVLGERFKPIQDDLAKLGVQYHESWIGIVEVMSSAVLKATSLYDQLKAIPDILADAGRAPFWSKLTELSGKFGLNSDPHSLGLTLPGEPGFAAVPGQSALTAGLNNPAAVRRAMQDATDIQSKVRGDTSKADPGKAQAEVNDQYDRAIETLQKHTARLQADTEAVGLGAGALEEFRARNQLMTAAQQAGIPVTDDVAKKIRDVSKAAGEAGDALAKAKVASDVKFGTGTAFLSQADVQIATQLKGIYGNDIPAALNSTYAAGIRVNNAFREISTAIETNLTQGLTDIVTGTTNVSDGFRSMGIAVLKAIEQMIIKIAIVQPMMAALQASVGGGSGILGLLGLGGGAGAQAASASTLAGNTGGAFFGPGFGTGGYTGSGGRNQPAGIVHKGEYVFDQDAVNRIGVSNLMRLQKGYAEGGWAGMPTPRDISPSSQGGPALAITYAPQIDARGVDPRQLGMLATQQAKFQRDFERNVKAVVSKTRQNSPGAF